VWLSVNCVHNFCVIKPETSVYRFCVIKPETSVFLGTQEEVKPAG
jgi:hypothetical protein